MLFIVLLATALAVALLLYGGICPMTIQVLVIAVLLSTAVVRAEKPTEHFSSGPAPDTTPVPLADALTNEIDTASGGLSGAMSVADAAAGANFECADANTLDDALSLTTQWTGPPSNTAGVFGDQWTVAATVRLTEAAQVPLLTVSGMTAAGLGAFQLLVQPGPVGRRQIVLTYGASSVSHDVSATVAPVTVVVRRDGATVTLIQAVHGVSDVKERGDVELDASMKAQVTAPMTIGGSMSAGPCGSLLKLLVWKAALSDADIQKVCDQALASQLVLQPAYKGIMQQRDAALTQAQSARSRNPWDSDGIQQACSSSVPDWTAPGALFMAPPTCRDAVSAHCSARPTSKGCECWGTPDTPGCKKLMSVMSGAVVPDLQNLTPGQLAAIKAKYFQDQQQPQQPQQPPGLSEEERQLIAANYTGGIWSWFGF